MTPKNQELRDSLKQIETTITSALAHQPEDDAQCGQFLYDALVSVFNTADLAAHKYRSLASATSTPDGAAPTAPVPSVPQVPSVPSNVGEHETLPEIEEDLRSDKRRFSNSDATAIASRIEESRKRLEESHKREVEAFKQRIKELDAQVAAKDEVIKRLNYALAEGQRRKLATAEKSSEVGDAAHSRERGNVAKLREALCDIVMLTMKVGYSIHGDVACGIIASKAKRALAAPLRNCDVGTAREQEKRHKEEVCSKSACPKNEGFVCNACKGCFAMWAQMPYTEGGAK